MSAVGSGSARTLTLSTQRPDWPAAGAAAAVPETRAMSATAPVVTTVPTTAVTRARRPILRTLIRILCFLCWSVVRGLLPGPTTTCVTDSPSGGDTTGRADVTAGV